jgi:hypothetical protein
MFPKLRLLNGHQQRAADNAGELVLGVKGNLLIHARQVTKVIGEAPGQVARAGS